MSIIGSLFSAFSADDYTLPCPDSSLIMQSFSNDAFLFLRTPSNFYKKPHYKRLYKKTTKSDYEYNLSAYRTKINQSQAKGLLKHIQGELDLWH